jgi:hypothetical protein
MCGIADTSWLHDGIAPVSTEEGLRTPSLGVLATPVGVVNEGGFVHDWIVCVFTALQVIFMSKV